MSAQGYTVNVYDQAGMFRETVCADFRRACLIYDHERSTHPQKVVCVFNLDRCDYDTDGLTDDERDQLDRPPPTNARSAP